MLKFIYFGKLPYRGDTGANARHKNSHGISLFDAKAKVLLHTTA